jgi:hypothetical protein
MRALRSLSIPIVLGLLLSLSSAPAYSQGQGPKKEKQLPKQINKEARKLAGKAEKAAAGIGQNAVFCLLAAHTALGTGPELKEQFEALEDVSFGEFVVAVVMSEITEIPLDEIITQLQEGVSFGEIAREAGVGVEVMGDVHRGLADFRGDVIQALTHPPTTDCFEEPV